MVGQLQAIWLLSADLIPLWPKVGLTLFVLVLVPVYWVQYGPGNFLWFSDIALLLAVPALWLESSLLASMMAVAVGLLELAWIVDFVVRLIAGVSVTGLSTYMFDSRISPAIRALSLFHLWLPVLLLWMISRLGYDSRAFAMQTLLSWIVLPMSYWLTKPSENVNWVYGLQSKPQTLIPAWLYLILLMVLFPLTVYLPTHLVLKTLFGIESSAF
jgi:hypothetical protein